MRFRSKKKKQAKPDETEDSDEPLITKTSSGKFVYVVAIDIGTTYSGYAVSTDSDPSNIRVKNDLGDDDGCSSHKTPTCLLLDKHAKFKAFGSTAQREVSLLKPDEANKCLYFERFKMMLHITKVCNNYCNFEF